MAELNIPFAHQEFLNSCWAACGRLAYNYFEDQTVYTNDTSFAKAAKLDPNKVQSIEDVLKLFTMYDSSDDTANIPSFDEIKKEIEVEKRPLIICISGTPVPAGGDCIDGHYVLLIGCKIEKYEEKILILDPANEARNNASRWIKYDSKTYYSAYGNYFWGIPYYLKPPN